MKRGSEDRRWVAARAATTSTKQFEAAPLPSPSPPVVVRYIAEQRVDASGGAAEEAVSLSFAARSDNEQPRTLLPSPRRLCFHVVCLSVFLFVSRIMHRLLDRFLPKSVERWFKMTHGLNRKRLDFAGNSAHVRLWVWLG